MEITLTASQESAVIRQHGSLDYLTTYVTAYCDHLINKQADDDRAAKVNKIIATATEKELTDLTTAIDARAAEAQVGK